MVAGEDPELRLPLLRDQHSRAGKKTYAGCVIRLEVEEENERAVKVYEKNGFHVLPYMEMITNE